MNFEECVGDCSRGDFNTAVQCRRNVVVVVTSCMIVVRCCCCV